MARAKLNRSRLPTYIPAQGIEPLCPHCDEPVEGLYQQRLDEPTGKGYLWFCMSCRKVLGVSHRKGFWMG
jgi:hypothetical protein